MITQLYTTQHGGTAYHDSTGLVFHTVPDGGHFAIGDRVPHTWEVQPIDVISVGVMKYVSERRGYADCLLGKACNPYVRDSRAYAHYQAGFDRAVRERVNA